MKETIEEITCNAILQNPQKIVIKGDTYTVAPPTVATIIEVSKYISQIPDIQIDEDGNVIMGVLASAKDCGYFGDVVAILMLGKKNLVTEKKYMFGLIKRNVNNQLKLADELLNNLSAEELNNLMLEIFKLLKVDFFFSISIFLKDVNQLKRTKGTEVIVSGER
jgi:hypothetical protein